MSQQAGCSPQRPRVKSQHATLSSRSASPRLTGLQFDTLNPSMTRRWRALQIFLACSLVALIVWVAWPRDSEPLYRGKKLSEWLFLYTVYKATKAGSSEPAALAVREIGTNGLPWLMRAISFEPAQWQQAAAKLPQPFCRVAMFRSGILQRAEALHGFHILGPAARPAIPQLTDWANNAPTSSLRKAYAQVALREMGQDFLQVPRLVQELHYPDTGIRERATNDLLRIAPEMLTNHVKSAAPNLNVRPYE